MLSNVKHIFSIAAYASGSWEHGKGALAASVNCCHPRDVVARGQLVDTQPTLSLFLQGNGKEHCLHVLLGATSHPRPRPGLSPWVWHHPQWRSDEPPSSWKQNTCIQYAVYIKKISLANTGQKRRAFERLSEVSAVEKDCPQCELAQHAAFHQTPAQAHL